MDSNKIRNLAFGARDALRREAAARIEAALAEGSAERLERAQEVKALEASIKESGLEKVVDSSAYTWFNRLCALRFMDARGYTPVGVVTPRPGSTQPAILADAAQGIFDPDFGFDRLTRDRVTALLSGAASASNPTEEAYAELLRGVCACYAVPMPYLFDPKTASPLAMPQGLLAEGSILRRIVQEMDDAACSSVEVLGWLYQFYVEKRKDEFFGSKKKAKPEDIAPATQLFTPNWIVRYLVENSVGRLWLLNNPHSDLASKMDYYIAPEGETEDCLKVYSPEEITVCDPACGSGHILVYAFDLLYEIYLEEGYPAESIPELILKNNLSGMEIDARAAEIAKFALEMKAREKDPEFFDKDLDADVCVLEPVSFGEGELAGCELLAEHNLLDAFAHMTECGSLYVPKATDLPLVEKTVDQLRAKGDMLSQVALSKLESMREILTALSRRFSCVVANPPYMASSSFDAWASSWTKKNYPDEKSDLCTCFIKRGISLGSKKGYIAMITMQSWMFESSFEKLRRGSLANVAFCNLLHLGIKAFKSIGNDVVQTCAFSFSNQIFPEDAFDVIKLDDCKNYELKQEEFFNPDLRYRTSMEDIKSIPGMPFTAYWVSESIVKAWADCSYIEDYGIYTGSQNVTGKNETYLRFFWEVDHDSIQPDYWVPYAKGGNFRRYYGNLLHVIDWREPAREFYRTNSSSNLLDESLWYRKGITYSAVTSRGTGFRYLPEGCVFDKGGASIIIDAKLHDFLAILNSRVASLVFSILNPSINLQVRDIKAFPFLLQNADSLATTSKQITEIAKNDWDENEFSLDFKEQPLLSLNANSLTEALRLRENYLVNKHAEVQVLLEKVDSECCAVYSIDPSDLPPLEERDYPVKRFNARKEIQDLVSYGVGCIMGRYSYGTQGTILAGKAKNICDFEGMAPSADFVPDEDAIVPVLDNEWFKDDMVTQFKTWIGAVFGKDSLDENIEGIENVLGKDLRTYFAKDFYLDHVKLFQKRPIYWMFQSPKGGFRALVYMHRYTPSTVGHLLTKYLREYIQKLNASIAALEGSNRAADKRQADAYRTTVNELTDWERNVIYPLASERISVDLDDGVKVNYNKFPYALAKVSGLSGWK